MRVLVFELVGDAEDAVVVDDAIPEEMYVEDGVGLVVGGGE